MKKYLFVLLQIIVSSHLCIAQTSWTGAENTKWDDKDNWTNGKPGKNDDVIIGDANFTGAYQPELKGKSVNVITLPLAIRVKCQNYHYQAI